MIIRNISCLALILIALCGCRQEEEKGAADLSSAPNAKRPVATTAPQPVFNENYTVAPGTKIKQ